MKNDCAVRRNRTKRSLQPKPIANRTTKRLVVCEWFAEVAEARKESYHRKRLCGELGRHLKPKNVNNKCK